MGLLDSLASGQGGGGLLDFLRANGIGQQFGAGLPSDQAQYGAQPSPFNAMAQMAPAPTPPAAPIQQPAANGTQPQSPFIQGQMLQPQGTWDKINQGLQSLGSGGSIIGAITGNRTDPQSMALGVQNQTLSAKYNGLIAAGYTPREAMVGAVDPEAFKSMAPQAFGGEPGKTLEIEGADGIKRQAEFKDGKWQYINPAGTSTSPPNTTAGQFGKAAPYPPAPPGVNVHSYNTAIADKAASEAADVQTKAEGAVNALKVLTRLKDRATAAHDRAYGPISGSETGQTINSVMGSVPFLGQGDSNVAGQQSELQGLYNDAGSSMLKARYGQRITNVDVHQGMKIVGGLSQPNKETALKTIDNNMIEAYDALQEGIKRGVVNPAEVLQRPTTAQQAASLGKGALYIAPDGSVRRNPQ